MRPGLPPLQLMELPLRQRVRHRRAALAQLLELALDPLEQSG